RNASWRRGVPAEDKAKWDRLLNWRLYREYSGGLMAELACHQFDTINWFLGAPPISVQGIAGLDWYKDGRDVWDNVHVIYTYPDGVKVTYESLCTNAFDGEGCYFYGKEGTLCLSEGGGSLYREQSAEKLAWADMAHTEKDARGHTAVVLNAGATTKADKRERTAGVALAGGNSQNQNNYFLEFLDFFEVVRHPEQKKPFADALTGLEVAATVLRANDAMEKGMIYRFKKEDFTA
ncbi:MAG TPA: Gfo/Idh/MocA family oxidoreductase, partial [Armatimonadota bacterium]|nr:Gfo/Idh/MocA family oxidoreductase [Armatimonadota bacterium]